MLNQGSEIRYFQSAYIDRENNSISGRMQLSSLAAIGEYPTLDSINGRYLGDGGYSAVNSI